MRKYNSRFGFHFNEFIGLSERASLTLKREPKPDGDGFQETILFNYQTLGKYEESLSQYYIEIGGHINHFIDQLPLKIQKLNYLAGILSEIKGVDLLLTEDLNGNLFHRGFSYTDVSEEPYRNSDSLGQDSIQPYLITLKRYIFLIKDSVEGIKNNIEGTIQSELPIPNHLQPKAFDSTMEIPEKFLDYLVVKSGVAVIRKDFKPTEQDWHGYDHVSWDEKTETKTFYDRDYETGEPLEMSYSFSNHLFNILYLQVNNFKTLVDERISITKTTDEIKLYISLVAGRVRYLYEVYNHTSAIKKYEKIGEALKALIRYLYQKYPLYCPEKDQFVEEILNASKLFSAVPQPELLPAPKTPRMFRWIKGSPERLNTLLHAKLNANFIEAVELHTFSKVFGGEYGDSSFTIKWIDRPKSNGIVNKVNLLYLFKRLADSGLIDIQYESPEMIRRLEHIFTDAKGQKLTNWTQSKKNVRSMKSMTVQQSLIDQTVTILCSEAAI